MSDDLTLRPYQVRAIDLVLQHFDTHRRLLMVAPTGSGKTIIAAALLKNTKRWRRVLWLAHRAELIDNARRTLERFGLFCGVQCAKHLELHPEHANATTPYQIGSVQTICRQGKLARTPDLIVFDEAHRSMADSYQDIARLAPDARVLGLTATPCRLDGNGLGTFYEEMLTVVTPSELYSDGYLRAPLTYVEDEDQVVTAMRGAKVAGGDFTRASMSRAVDRADLIGNVVSHAARLAHGVPKVVFAATVAHSQHIAKRFRDAGISAAHLDADTPATERACVVSALGSGELEVVTNVDLFCEGWDLPGLGAVILARPTKSFARLVQMIGRVQRPEGPSTKLVLDHGANCTRLQHFPGENIAWTLEHGALKRRASANGFLVKPCVKCNLIIEWTCQTCPQCGTNQPQHTLRDVPVETDADLVALERAKFEQRREALRARARTIADARGLDDVWIERVVEGELPRQ